MRISKVVTKTGDKGQTGLIGGQRVSKSSARVTAYGEVDELNSLMGVASAYCQDPACKAFIEEIQHRLFTVGADLASPEGVAVPRTTAEHVQELETFMDSLMDELPPLEEFILPGGGLAGSHLHLARTVARRCERATVQLDEDEDINPQAIIYLNRLSDLLFVMARIVNKREGCPETLADFSDRKKNKTK